MMETLSSSETSVLTRVTQRNIPEDVILHRHRSEKLQILQSNILAYGLMLPKTLPFHYNRNHLMFSSMTLKPIMGLPQFFFNFHDPVNKSYVSLDRGTARLEAPAYT
jgi:hypothetical protein